MAYVVVARWRANAGSEDRVVAVLEELTGLGVQMLLIASDRYVHDPDQLLCSA